MQLEVLGNILDEEQKKAAFFNQTNSIIIAGAGSGKSLTMVGKIKYLVKYQNVPLANILCITFTNNAAKSLENKIKKELKQDNTVYTFHKLALDILKDYNLKYTIIEPDFLTYLINEVLDSLYPSPYFIKLFQTKNYLNNKNYINYKKTIERFLSLYFANYYDLNYFRELIQKAFWKKDREYLRLIKKIAEIYTLEKKSSNLIDFDDMIYLATKLVRDIGIKKNYQYIIIDEYQDTSMLRENLINEIVKKTNSILTVVGDDFQSIYRFSGCDLRNFLDFSKHFKPAKKLYLTNTYRNSMELIQVAGSFVMKNPKQIKKNLKSKKKIPKPLVILYYQDEKKDFKKALEVIKDSNIMILGRNNLDIYQVLDNISLNENMLDYQNKNIYYKTIHKAKGLEEEQVLVINLTNNLNSLPSRIKEENILKYVIGHDFYPFEEERRLFYVALTRTKNYCYLYVDKKNISIFVQELLKIYQDFITEIDL